MNNTATSTLDTITKLSILVKDVEEALGKIEDLKKLIEDLKLTANGTVKKNTTDQQDTYGP